MSSTCTALGQEQNNTRWWQDIYLLKTRQINHIALKIKQNWKFQGTRAHYHYFILLLLSVSSILIRGIYSKCTCPTFNALSPNLFTRKIKESTKLGQHTMKIPSCPSPKTFFFIQQDTKQFLIGAGKTGCRRFNLSTSRRHAVYKCWWRHSRSRFISLAVSLEWQALSGIIYESHCQRKERAISHYQRLFYLILKHWITYIRNTVKVNKQWCRN